MRESSQLPDLPRGRAEITKKIYALERRLAMSKSEVERAQLQRTLEELVAKLKKEEESPVTLWTPDGEHRVRPPDGARVGDHVSSTPETSPPTCCICGCSGNDDDEVFPNEKFYCKTCTEYVVNHQHRCPVCGTIWIDSLGANCTKPELAKCWRCTGTDPDGRGLAKVAGMNELKAQFYAEVVRPLRDPEPFMVYKIGIPNGILLFGPPGCGKTYIARQLAEELDYAFWEVFPSQIGGTYIHETALKIREVFSSAAERAPSVIFIDEFEGLVPHRSELSAHQEARAEEVNEFLKQIESCAAKQILLIAATNEPWKIDPAVQRSGRLDKKLYVGPPDSEARAALLRFHLHGRPVEASVDIVTLAGNLAGYSASDVKLLVDEAAKLAFKSRVPINSDHLWAAIGKVPASISIEQEERYQAFAQRGA